jgi:hypothetical protein
MYLLDIENVREDLKPSLRVAIPLSPKFGIRTKHIL